MLKQECSKQRLETINDQVKTAFETLKLYNASYEKCISKYKQDESKCKPFLDGIELEKFKYNSFQEFQLKTIEKCKLLNEL